MQNQTLEKIGKVGVQNKQGQMCRMVKNQPIRTNNRD